MNSEKSAAFHILGKDAQETWRVEKLEEGGSEVSFQYDGLITKNLAEKGRRFQRPVCKRSIDPLTTSALGETKILKNWIDRRRRGGYFRNIAKAFPT